MSLRDLKVTNGAKMMVVGSTIDDVITVQSPSTSQTFTEVSKGKSAIHTQLFNLLYYSHATGTDVCYI